MKKISIKDIAQQLNISTATVSYILNGKAKEKRIGDELAKKVRKYIKDINYEPNQLAQSLRTGKTNIICLMVEDIADQFFAALAGHIETIAYERGYKIIYCSTKNNTDKAKELIKTFKLRNVDGYIITPPLGIENEIKNLIKSKVPVILFDRYYEDVNVSYVGMNNLESSYNAINHLYEQGYKNIACVTLDSTQTQMQDRLKGYKNFLKEHKQKPIVKKFSYSDRMKNQIVDGITKMIKRHPKIDAIFFATNYLAISGLEALNNLGVIIPNQIGIVVFDDNDLFRIHQPSITAVTQPINEMSDQLINILLEHMGSDENYLAKSKVLPATLTIRQSSVRCIK